MAGYIGKNVQVASTSSTAEGRDLMEAQSVAEQRALLDVDSKAEVDAKDAVLQADIDTKVAATSGQALAAANSASAASSSETNAAGSASSASTSASNASTSATNAANSASSASNSATAAATSATEAEGYRDTVVAKEALVNPHYDAIDSAYTNIAAIIDAPNQATTATTQAGIATTQANNAAASATTSVNAKTASESARDAALAALDSFDDRYLGQKATEPTLDNDGDALVSGALFFNTTTNSMMVYDGGNWLAAYASLSGVLLSDNNLSDLSDVQAALTALGLNNVDNTSDVNKPISTATQTALNGKVDDSQVLTNVPAGAVFTDTVYNHPSTHPATMITTTDEFAYSNSGNVQDVLDDLDQAIANVNAKDPVITLTGDVSGSGTMTNLGNVSITATVADDSHNHTIANVDGLQTALDGKLSTSGKAADANLLDGLDSSKFLRSDASDTMTGTLNLSGGLNVVCNPFRFQRSTTSQTGQDDNVSVHVDDSNIYFTHNNDSDGDASGYNFRYTSGGSAVNLVNFSSGSFSYKGNTIWHAGNDGSGSGLDADTVDGVQASSFLRADANSNRELATNSNSSAYSSSAIELREYNKAGVQTGAWSEAPRLSFHWGDRAASSIALATDGDICIMNNPGTGYEDLRMMDCKVYGTVIETSDARLKENVRPITNALSKVTSLQGVHYNKIESPDNEEIGFIAQEVEEVVPEIVTTDNTEEGMKAVSYARTVALLVEAMKEQQAKIEELELRLKQGGL